MSNVLNTYRIKTDLLLELRDDDYNDFGQELVDAIFAVIEKHGFYLEGQVVVSEEEQTDEE